MKHQPIALPQDVVPVAFVRSLALCMAAGALFWMSALTLLI